MKKNVSSNTRFCKKISFALHYICKQSEFTDEFKLILNNPDRFCNANVMKEDHTFTTTVVKVRANNKLFVIKRYNIKGFSHGFKRSIQPTRAARCWHYAHVLKRLNIKTPEPVAFIEKRFGPLRRQAYFITEHVPGPDGHIAFIDEPNDVAITQERANNTMKLLMQLRENCIYHGDLKDTNFVYNGSTPYILDLDAMRQYQSHEKAVRKLTKDKNRFLLNWRDLDVMKYFKEMQQWT